MVNRYSAKYIVYRVGVCPREESLSFRAEHDNIARREAFQMGRKKSCGSTYYNLTSLMNGEEQIYPLKL